jgi:DNA-binding response OmpR family regulator
MDRILVIEDDPKVQKAMSRLFEPEGFSVEIAPDGCAGLQAFSARQPAIVLLDLRMPGMNGKDVCQEIKRLSPAVPIIVVSATSDEMDKVLLLELGADDYITKPFSPRELLARTRAALRRVSRVPAVETFSFGEVLVDFTRMQLTRAGQSLSATAQEFKLLKFMIEHRERVISRDELLNEVWGYQDYPSTRTVDNHILKLRQKLEPEPANPAHFLTVYGVGYRFVL